MNNYKKFDVNYSIKILESGFIFFSYPSVIYCFFHIFPFFFCASITFNFALDVLRLGLLFFLQGDFMVNNYSHARKLLKKYNFYRFIQKFIIVVKI